MLTASFFFLYNSELDLLDKSAHQNELGFGQKRYERGINFRLYLSWDRSGLPKTLRWKSLPCVKMKFLACFELAYKYAHIVLQSSKKCISTFGYFDYFFAVNFSWLGANCPKMKKKCTSTYVTRRKQEFWTKSIINVEIDFDFLVLPSICALCAVAKSAHTIIYTVWKFSLSPQCGKTRNSLPCHANYFSSNHFKAKFLVKS